MLCEPLLATESTAPPKAELSLQGDDFTRQMWQMYAVFEDLLERQNLGSDVCPSSRGGIPSSAIPFTLMQQFSEGRGASEGGPSPSMLAEALATAEGARLLESYERMLAEADYDVWSTMVAAPREVDDESDEEDDDDEVDLVKRGIRREMQLQGRQAMFEDSTTEFDSDEVLETERRYRHHQRQEYPEINFQPFGPSSQQAPHQQRSLKRHRHRMRRRLPATPTTRTSSQSRSSHPYNPYHHQHRLVEELTRSSPSVHMGESVAASAGDDVGIGVGSLESASESTLPFRRSSAPELLDNPLLETISTIEDLCESDDYGEALAASATLLNSSNNSSGLSVDKDSSKAVKSDPSSSAEEKAQHSSDGDRDSVGYAGSNSVDSGYKSSCPTPELLDPCYYAQDALCNGSKRYPLISRASREGKPRIPMGTRVIGRHHHHQARSAPASTPWSAAGPGLLAPSGSSGNGGTSTSVGFGGGTVGGAATPNRPEYGYYDVNLDHLMYLRQSLLSAIKRCGGSVSPARISPSDSDCSGCQTAGNATGSATGSSSRHGSPMRSRSSSRASRESPDQHKSSPSPSSSPQFSHLRGVRFKADAGGKADSGPFGMSPPGTARASSPNTSNSQLSPNVSAHATPPKSESPLRKCRSKTIRKEPSGKAAQEGGETSSVAAPAPILEEEIDTLLYGRAEYYDLESVQEFPCSYGTMVENKHRRSSLAKVKKLKDSLKDQETDYGSSKVSSQFPQAQPSLFSSPTHCPGYHQSSTSNKSECMVPEKDTFLAANIDQVSSVDGAHKETSMSQGHETMGSKDIPENSPRPDQEIPADKAKFSEVAKCMLKIIEDIQHQQQNGCTAGSLEGKAPFNSAAKEGINGIAQNLHNASQHLAAGRHASPGVYDSQRLSGADYHVYEEITYDLVTATSRHVFKESSKRAGPAAKVSGRRFKCEDVPPPLPARPNEIFGGVQSAMPAPSKQLPSSFGSLGHQQACNPNVGMHAQTQLRNPNIIKRRGNLYSLFTEQSERRHLSQSLEREWQKSNGVEAKDSNDDEYGFKAIKKQPPRDM